MKSFKVNDRVDLIFASDKGGVLKRLQKTFAHEVLIRP
jgi:hypothetical protein